MLSKRSRPVPGERPSGKKDRRVLLFAFFDPRGISTVPQSIHAWQLHSRHEVVVLNLWPGRGTSLMVPESVSFDDFDALIVHPTVSYFASNLDSLDRNLKGGFAAFNGVKVLMKQDEQVTTSLFANLVRTKGFDFVFTCVPPVEQDKVYPRASIGDCELVHVLTGYVSPAMRNGPEELTRDIDVSYRGSIQPLEFGQLGYEKRGIGYDISRALTDCGFRLDISSRWEDRVHGDEWARFLARSRVVLGVESGSNLFDFDGKVAEWCRGYEAAHTQEDPTSERYYSAAHEAYLHEFEGNVNYAQISPRHFEAAAAGSAQLLYEGDYSGIFRPNEHFMPLRRDLANLGEVIDFIRDEKARSRMVERAFEEIILDRRYWYETFVAETDDAIERKCESKGLLPNKQHANLLPFNLSDRPVAFVLAAHEPTVDPRIGWFASSLSETHEVYVIGTYRYDQVGEGPTYEVTDEGIHIVRVERTKHNASWLPSTAQLLAGPSRARGLLASLAGYAALPEGIMADRIGAHGAKPEEIGRFRELCTHFVNTNSALLEAMQKMGSPDLIVAADLETLPSAIALADDVGSFCVFDAHEFWPYSLSDFQYWEIEFWLGVERQLSRAANLRLTVSPQLARAMSAEYDCEFLVIPNCARRSEGDGLDVEGLLQSRSTSGPLNIIFLGGIAEGRGLEDAIRAFASVKSDARLIIQGHDSPHRRKLMHLAESLHLAGHRVHFPSAVSESMLISTAAEAHIGLIPYDPANLNNRFCCPNKLSQYAAAGLPIISSRTEYVAEIVNREKIGYVVDISNPKTFAALIDSVSDARHELIDMGRRARHFFVERYNWDAVALDVLCRIRQAAAFRKSNSRIDLDWISHARSRRQRHGIAAPISPTLFGGAPAAHYEQLAPAAHYEQLQVQPGAVGSAKVQFVLLRRLWHLLPKSVRYLLAAWLRKYVS